MDTEKLIDELKDNSKTLCIVNQDTFFNMSHDRDEWTVGYFYDEPYDGSYVIDDQCFSRDSNLNTALLNLKAQVTSIIAKIKRYTRDKTIVDIKNKPQTIYTYTIQNGDIIENKYTLDENARHKGYIYKKGNSNYSINQYYVFIKK